MSEANLTEVYHVAGTGICKHILKWEFDAPLALASPILPSIASMLRASYNRHSPRPLSQMLRVSFLDRLLTDAYCALNFHILTNYSGAQASLAPTYLHYLDSHR